MAGGAGDPCGVDWFLNMAPAYVFKAGAGGGLLALFARDFDMAFFRGLGGKSRPLAGDKIGLCKIEGMITDSREVVDFLRDLRRDDSVKGVLLRIDSPGGAVAPSQELYQAVRALAKVKPVVVSMGTAAASGGYYAAAPATLIVANSGTITGSIGVRAQYVNLQGLLEKLGLKSDIMMNPWLATAVWRADLCLSQCSRTGRGRATWAGIRSANCARPRGRGPASWPRTWPGPRRAPCRTRSAPAPFAPRRC